MKSALLIQTAFIGDVILTTPMIAAFKKEYPQVKLDVLTTPAGASILSSNPEINDLIIFDKKKHHRGITGMFRMIQEVRNRKFDLLLSPHKSHRTGILATFSGIPTRFGYSGAGFARFAYTKLLKRDTSLPEIRRLLHFLSEALNISTKKSIEIPCLFETEASRLEARQILAELAIPSAPILMAVSSVWSTKRWPPWNFARLAALLIAQLRGSVLLIGSKDDFLIAEEVLSYMREFHSPDIADRVVNLCGKTSLLGLYSLMKHSSLLVSNDSSPVHFACAARLPLTAIFGPTTPALGYAPLTPESKIAELLELECRPCGTHGGHVCPREHFRCMQALDPEMVLETSLQAMQLAPDKSGTS